MFKLDKAIWISWEQHRRSQSLAKCLNIPLYQFESNQPRWGKHPFFILQTLIILFKKRPYFLFVQNPSAFLTLLTIFFKPFFGYKLIVDAHNAGVYPFKPSHEKYGFIFPFIHRHSNFTIVTNKILSDIIKQHGGKPLILPDPLPELVACHKTDNYGDQFVVTFVCSYSSDEPYLEVFKAASLLPDNVRIFVTGDDSKLKSSERSFAEKNNIVLTGFLDDKEYLLQLCNSDCIMVLTQFADCMVCGAYEGTALNIPLILSDSSVLRDWFEAGAVFTKNESTEIANAILHVRNDHLKMLNDVKILMEIISIKWNKLFEKVLVEIRHA